MLVHSGSCEPNVFGLFQVCILLLASIPKLSSSGGTGVGVLIFQDLLVVKCGHLIQVRHQQIFLHAGHYLITKTQECKTYQDYIQDLSILLFP